MLLSATSVKSHMRLTNLAWNGIAWVGKFCHAFVPSRDQLQRMLFTYKGDQKKNECSRKCPYQARLETYKLIWQFSSRNWSSYQAQRTPGLLPHPLHPPYLPSLVYYRCPDSFRFPEVWTLVCFKLKFSNLCTEDRYTQNFHIYLLRSLLMK